MESTNAKVSGLDRGHVALEKDLEFISGVAKNHRHWNLSAAKTVAALIGWPCAEKVLQLGRKAIKANKTSAGNWDIN